MRFKQNLKKVRKSTVVFSGRRISQAEETGRDKQQAVQKTQGRNVRVSRSKHSRESSKSRAEYSRGELVLCKL